MPPQLGLRRAPGFAYFGHLARRRELRGGISEEVEDEDDDLDADDEEDDDDLDDEDDELDDEEEDDDTDDDEEEAGEAV